MLTAPQFKAKLARFLKQHFSNSELVALLDYNEIGHVPAREQLSDALPAPSVSRDRFVDEMVRLLLARGLLTESFFRVLQQERRALSEEISSLDAAWVALRDRERVSARFGFEPLQSDGNPFLPFQTFVGRQHELEAITTNLREGRSTLLIGGRRAGKTALSRQLTEASVGGRTVLPIDVSRFEPLSEAQFIADLGSAIGGAGSCVSRADLIALLLERSPLVLVLDEVDRLLRQPWVEPFFAFLRHLDDTRLQQRLSLLLLGGPSLADYRSDDYGSPALNTTEIKFLDPLDDDACDALIGRLTEPVEGAERLREELGGHPWLLTETLARLHAGDSLRAALNHMFQTGQSTMRHWRTQLGEPGLRLLHEIDRKPIPDTDFDFDGARAAQVSAWNRLCCLCLVQRRDGMTFPGPRLALRLLLSGGAP